MSPFRAGKLMQNLEEREDYTLEDKERIIKMCDDIQESASKKKNPYR